MNNLPKKIFEKIGLVVLLLSCLIIFFCARDPDPILMVDLRDDLKLKGSLCGTVTDAKNGKPISAVSILIEGTGNSTLSLPDGSFKIPNIASGVYTLHFRHNYYLDTTIKNIVLSINQNLTISDTITMVSAKAKLTGKSILSTQKAVPAAGVAIAYQPYQTLSNDSGYFGFPELISGQITAVAACMGLGWGEKSVNLKPGDSAEVFIILDKKGGSLRGRVLDADNNPMQNTIVSAMNGAISDTTNENGEYSLNNLPSSIPLTITAGPQNTISGIRVTEGGQLSGLELKYTKEIHSSGITLGNPTIISSQEYPVYLWADVHADSNNSNVLDSIYSFVWDTNYDHSIDTMTTTPELVLKPDVSWGTEKSIEYGIIMFSGDTLWGGMIKIMRVSSVPQVNAAVSKTQLRTGEPAFFTGNTVTLDKSILKYIWEFGDSSTWVRTDISDVIHRYSKPGLYKAIFKAITETDTSSDSVTIAASGVHFSLALDSLFFPENVSFDKKFNTDSLYYSATVPFELNTVSLRVKPLDSTSIVICNDDTLNDDSLSKTVSLNVGNNVIKIYLISQYGLKGNYIFSITRNANPDAALSSLTAHVNGSEINFVFNPDSLQYNFSITDTMTGFSLRPSFIDTSSLLVIGTDTIHGDSTYVPALHDGDNTLLLKTLAPDRIHSRIYTIKVYRTATLTATLATLSVLDADSLIDLDFEPNRYHYTFTVPYTTDSLTLRTLANQPGDIVTVNGKEIGDSLKKDLSVGENNITISVFSPQNKLVKVYTLVVTREANPDASLKSVSIFADSIQLDLQFSMSTFTYSIPVSWGTDIISIKPVPQDSLSKIIIKENIIPFNGSYLFSPTKPADTLLMEITAPNAITSRTFTFILQRQAAPIPHLTGLKLLVAASNFLQDFSPSIISYTIPVPYETQSVSLIPEVADSAIILLNSDTLASNEETAFNILSNSTKISLLVKYPSIDTGITYTITVSKASDSDPLAANIGIYGFNLQPSFNSSTLTYTINVPSSLDTIDCSVATASSNATFSINGSTPQKSGIAHVAIESIDTMKILTISGDHSDSTSYLILINHTIPPVPNLNELKIMNQGTDFLSEQFNSSKTEYDISVPFETSALTVYPVASDSEMILVNFDTLAEIDSAVLSFTNSSMTITIQAIHQNADLKKTYTIHVNRLDDSNSSASSISLTDCTLSPVFSSDVFNYNAVVAPSMTNAVLTITPASPNARISVQNSAPSATKNYTIPISENDTIEVKIISGDKTDTSTYNLYISRTSYTLKISKTGAAGGSIFPSQDSVVTAGGSVTVSFTNTPDYAISELIIDGTSNKQPGSSYTFSNIRQSHSLVAVFTDIPKYTLKMSWSEGGTVGPQAIYTVHSRDTIDIYAKPSDGFLFAGWSVSDSAHIIDATKLQTKVYLNAGDGFVTATFLPKTLYVSTAGDDIYNGYSWLSAKRTLQAALDFAQTLNPTLSNPVQIWIAHGTYYPTIPSNINEPRSVTFTIPKYIHIYGGFYGNEPSPNQRQFKFDEKKLLNRFVYNTSLSGDLNGNGADEFDALRVLSGDSIVLNGVTIENGFNNLTLEDGCGALLGNAVVKNCDFTNTFTQNSGGALSCMASTKEVTIDSCFFSKNSCNRNGGAIMCYLEPNEQCKLLISNSVFTDNKNNARGGAIWINNTVVLNNCLFQNNTALSGGALNLAVSSPSTAEINRCIFRTNIANGNSYGGGAVVVFGENVIDHCKFTNCLFEQNQTTFQGADYGGGAISSLNISLKLMNCTFYGNSVASNYGGGIYVGKGDGYGEQTSIVNCIFWNNSAPSSGQTPFTNDILVSDYTTLTVANTCLRGIEMTGAPVSYPGLNNFLEYPDFKNIETQPFDLRLDIESSCINKGSDIGAPAVDITNKVRDNKPDVGAYEYFK